MASSSHRRRSSQHQGRQTIIDGPVMRRHDDCADATTPESDAESCISLLNEEISDAEPLYFPRKKSKQVTPCLRKSTPKHPITKETLENPRSIMSMCELEILLVQRDLPRRGNEEDHAMLVARLNKTDNDLGAKELNALLREAYMPTSFARVEKIRRLQRHDADNSLKGEQGLKATDMEFKRSYEPYRLYGIAL